MYRNHAPKEVQDRLTDAVTVAGESTIAALQSVMDETATAAQAQAALRRARTSLDELARSVTEVDTAEPGPDVVAVLFEVSFARHGSTLFRYVAVRATNGYWYLTGRDRAPHRWAYVLTKMREGRARRVRAFTLTDGVPLEVS